MKIIDINGIKIGGNNKLALIAGPCVIEEEELVLSTAEKIKKISEKVGIGFIFKSSYLKDNRSSANSYQGPGLDEGLEILYKVKKEIGVPVLSDVHRDVDVKKAAEVLDVIQIPAFLSMQTSLAISVGKTGKPVNVKKGQFLHPEDMKNVVKKLEGVGNYNIMLTERGTCFGYRNLVMDMKSLPIMKKLGYPVVIDPTHSLRNYGFSSSDPRGGDSQYIYNVSRAGVAAGCDVVFIETHPDCKNAKCDASSMLPLDKLEDLLIDLIKIDEIVRSKDE